MKRPAKTLILLLLVTTTGIYAQKPVTPVKKQVIQMNKEQVAKMTIQYDEVQRDLKALEFQQAQISRLLKDYQDRLIAVTVKVENLEKKYDQLLDSGESVRRKNDTTATKQLTEMQQSFNLQYLNLQQQMQNENRRFTTISNVMKTKHDTVKNSISNVK